MPLIKSKSKKSKESQPSKVDSLPIAMGTRRHVRKNMANGGMAKKSPYDTGAQADPFANLGKPNPGAVYGSESQKAEAARRQREAPLSKEGRKNVEKTYKKDDSWFAEGGMVKSEVADEIMRRRKEKAMKDLDAMKKENYMEDLLEDDAPKYADGGMVDLDEESEEHPNELDDLNIMAADHEQYDDSQLSPQPEDSNLMGDDIESDLHDRIGRIRAKLRAKKA